MFMYDEIQKEKDNLRHQDRIRMDWMVLLAILFHLIILYLIIPEFKSTRKWQEQKNSFIEMKRFNKPPPPEPEKKEPEKKIKKKKVLAKPIPEPEVDEIEQIDITDEDIEVVYDVTDIDFEEPEAPSTGPLRVGGDVKSPTLVKRVNPEYPDTARRLRIEGLVILEAIITKEGDVQNVKVIKPLNSFCDEAAMKAVKQWKFDPGTQNDIPVDVIMNLTVIFKMSS